MALSAVVLTAPLMVVIVGLSALAPPPKFSVPPFVKVSFVPSSVPPPLTLSVPPPKFIVPSVAVKPPLTVKFVPLAIFMAEFAPTLVPAVVVMELSLLTLSSVPFGLAAPAVVRLLAFISKP